MHDKNNLSTQMILLPIGRTKRVSIRQKIHLFIPYFIPPEQTLSTEATPLHRSITHLTPKKITHSTFSWVDISANEQSWDYTSYHRWSIWVICIRLGFNYYNITSLHIMNTRVIVFLVNFLWAERHKWSDCWK